MPTISTQKHALSSRGRRLCLEPGRVTQARSLTWLLAWTGLVPGLGGGNPGAPSRLARASDPELRTQLRQRLTTSASAEDARLVHTATFSKDEQAQALGVGGGSTDSTLCRAGGRVKSPRCSLHVGLLGSWAGGDLSASPWLLPSLGTSVHSDNA